MKATWLLSCLIAAGAASGQVAPSAGQAPARGLQPLVFGSSVTLVAVPVFVTDKNGVAVASLTADDFEVLENDKPVPIVAFQAVDVDKVEPSTGPSPLGPSGPRPLALQAETRRQFVILIDREFSSVRGLHAARPAAADFVRRALAPSDLVSVVDSGRSGFVTLVSFTTDHEYAARVISENRPQPGGGADPLGISGRAGGSGPLSILGGITGGQAFASPSQNSGSARVDAELAYLEGLEAEAAANEQAMGVTRFVSDLLRLIHDLSALRGRKQIVLLSGGFPERAWQALPSDKTSSPLAIQAMRDLRKVAALSDIVINTISLDGIRAAGDVGESQGPDVNGPPQAASALNQGAGRGTLVALALDTGGRFINPTNNYGVALREVDRISRHFYVLGFEASEDVDGQNRSRRLKVRTRRAGLSVSHRTEYRLTPASSGDSARRASEAIAKGLSGGALRLDLASIPHRDLDGKPTLHAVLEVDRAAFAELPPDPLTVEIYGYLMSEGKVVDSLAVTTSVDMAKFKATLRDDGLRVVTGFASPPARSDLRFFVRLGASGLSGSIQRLVDMPVSHRGDTALSPPMFTSPTRGRVVIPLQSREKPLQIPFRVGGQPFLPDVAVTLQGGLTREVCVFVASRAVSSAPFEVKGALVADGGALLPVDVSNLRLLVDTDGFDRYLMDVAPPRALPSGEYRLRLTFTDPANGRAVSTETVVRGEPGGRSGP